MSATAYLHNVVSEPIAIPRPMRFATGSIVALIDQPGQISGLISSLARLGIDRDAIEITRAHASASREPGIFERIADLLCCIGPERELSRHYRSALESGSIVVTVRNVSADRQVAVTSILKSDGGHYIHSFGRFTVRRLGS